MYDLLTQFPITDENTPIKELHEEAAEKSRAMAFDLGYVISGPPSFEVLELPLSMYLQCRAPVAAFKFGGGQHGR